MNRKKQRWLLLLLAAVSIGSVLWVGSARQTGQSRDWASASPQLQALMWPAPRDPVTEGLRAVDGTTFSAESLRGQWSLVYFGYLSCPDICPTTLQSMRGMHRLMQREQMSLDSQMLFVSVDPENDSAERISDYLQFFGGEIVGLRAEHVPLKRIADSLGVMYAEFVDEAGVRSVDHTSSIIVIDPNGRAVGALPPPHQSQTMLEQFALLAAIE